MHYNGNKIVSGLDGNVPGVSSGVISLVNNGVLAEMHVTGPREPVGLPYCFHGTSHIIQQINLPQGASIFSNKGWFTGPLITLNIALPHLGPVYCQSRAGSLPQ